MRGGDRGGVAGRKCDNEEKRKLEKGNKGSRLARAAGPGDLLTPGAGTPYEPEGLCTGV